MPRQLGEPTSEYLARSLEAVGLTDMARRARLFEYDDYKCPSDKPWAGLELNQLLNELRKQAHRVELGKTRRDQILAMAEKVIDGEFDGTAEESEAWAKGPEGQTVMQEIANSITKHNTFEEN